MDTDSFVLSFETNYQELINFLQQNKDEFDFSELDKSRELYNPNNLYNPILTLYNPIILKKL